MIGDAAPETTLAITIGDATTYRDQLEKSVELTDHLEQLRRDEQVTILDCPNWNVHDKLYRLAFDDSVSWLIGSANFSKNGWSSQHDDPCRNNIRYLNRPRTNGVLRRHSGPIRPAVHGRPRSSDRRPIGLEYPP
ncbi:restriction endonuclease PLD domain-containing protein [Halobacterium salinarum]|uniref:restriction endonuclease PLD domain-containing protein n=1 Tax=Halobacterium salinarum TaxID=2242 RepID=UPI003D76D338